MSPPSRLRRSRALSFGPHLPGRLAAAPELAQHRELSVRVHRLPEARVPEGHQLPIASESLEGLLLENAAFIKVVRDHVRLEDEEARVHVLVGLRLLPEPT